MRYLTIALAKGRLADKAMEMFEAIGISCDEMKDKASRKLIFVNEHLECAFSQKANDVPTYVEYGAADIGIVGRIPYWRRAASSMRSWTLGWKNAGCASADLNQPGKGWSTMS